MSKKLRYRQLLLELDPYRRAMGEAVQTILDKDVSEYPIMVVHQEELELGIPIVTTESYPGGNWNIHASTLEEFVAKQIISETRIQNFRATYKNPTFYICVFSLSELGAQFIFIPRREGDTKALDGNTSKS